MSHTDIWKQFGPAITEHPRDTLAAYLGHRPAQKTLDAASVVGPTTEDFQLDSVFDPDPHNLGLSADFVETALLVQSLAVWGPETLVRAAFFCARLQVEHQTDCPADLLPLREAAFTAVENALDTAGAEAEVKQAAAACAETYHPHEEAPDSPTAQSIWTHLGAVWFAAETAAQDDRLEDFDGPGPREASPTWCRRNSVWPLRAAETAAGWASHEGVRQVILATLIDWAQR